MTQNFKNQTLQCCIVLKKTTFIIGCFLIINLNSWSQKDKVTDCPPSKLKIDNVYFKIDSLESKIDSIENHLNNFYQALSDTFISKAIARMNDDQAKQMELLNNQIASANSEKDKAITERDQLILDNKTLTTEKNTLQKNLDNLKKENEAAWKTTAENLIKSSATAPVKLIDELISKNTNDAVLVSKLQAFKTQSEYLLTAQKFLMDGTGKSNYIKIKENLNKYIEVIYQDQVKLQTKLINELQIFENLAKDLDYVIRQIKNYETESVRTFEIEQQFKSASQLSYFPWLKDIYFANKDGHTPIGITFE